MKKVKVKKNDQVLVITGRDKGVVGKVLRVHPDQGTATVERVNLVKRHTRANPQKKIQGGILEREAPIRLSNLKVICPESSKPTRIGRIRTKEGEGARVCKASGAVIN